MINLNKPILVTGSTLSQTKHHPTVDSLILNLSPMSAQ